MSGNAYLTPCFHVHLLLWASRFDCSFGTQLARNGSAASSPATSATRRLPLLSTTLQVGRETHAQSTLSWHVAVLLLDGPASPNERISVLLVFLHTTVIFAVAPRRNTAIPPAAPPCRLPQIGTPSSRRRSGLRTSARSVVRMSSSCWSATRQTWATSGWCCHGVPWPCGNVWRDVFA